MNNTDNHSRNSNGNKIYFNKNFLIIGYFISIISLIVGGINIIEGGKAQIEKIQPIVMAFTGVMLLFQLLMWSLFPLIEINEKEIILRNGIFAKKVYDLSTLKVKKFDKGLTFIDENGTGGDIWNLMYSKKDFEKIINAVSGCTI